MSLGYAFSAQLRGAGIDLVGEGAHGDRDGGALDVEKAPLRRGAVVPIGTSRRRRRVRHRDDRSCGKLLFQIVVFPLAVTIK